MARSFTKLFILFILYNGCFSKTISNYDKESFFPTGDYTNPQDYTDSDSRDYMIDDNYGTTYVEWLRLGGNNDEDEEWKAYGESSEYPDVMTEPTYVNQVRNKHGYRIFDVPKISKQLKHGHNLLTPDNELVSGNDCNELIIVLKNEINTLNLKLQAQKEAMASLVNSISGGKQEQQVAQTQNTATNIQTKHSGQADSKKN